MPKKGSRQKNIVGWLWFVGSALTALVLGVAAYMSGKEIAFQLEKEWYNFPGWVLPIVLFLVLVAFTAMREEKLPLKTLRDWKSFAWIAGGYGLSALMLFIPDVGTLFGDLSWIGPSVLAFSFHLMIVR